MGILYRFPIEHTKIGKMLAKASSIRKKVGPASARIWIQANVPQQFLPYFLGKFKEETAQEKSI